MNPVSTALLRAGILNDQMKAQFRQWGMDVDAMEGEPLHLESPEQVASAIEMALNSEGLVLTRVTDLDMIKQFLATKAKGHLYLNNGEVAANFPVDFGTTLSGDLIIPWQSEGIYDLMVDPFTHIDTAEEEIYFQDVREIFYGEVKAFILCTPSVRHPLVPVLEAKAGSSDGHVS